MSDTANPGVEALATALASADVAERSRAAEELAHLGAEAQPAAVPLVRACGDEAEEVREWAVAALEELAAPLPTDLAALTELLDDVPADVGYWAATLLGRLEADATPAVVALANTLARAPAMSVRQRAAWALGKIGPGAASALESLREAASSGDLRLSQLAREAIAQVAS